MAEKQFNSIIQRWRALGLAGRIAYGFIDSKLTPLVIFAALLIGIFSILKTPREEEPQIVVPMLDVFVQMPGASAEEVEQRVSVPTEKLLRRAGCRVRLLDKSSRAKDADSSLLRRE